MSVGVQIIADHPFLPESWRANRGRVAVPDVNPAAQVYARMRARAFGSGDRRSGALGVSDGSDGLSGDPGSDGGGGAAGNNGGAGGSSVQALAAQTAKTKQSMCQILGALNNATIECDPDTSEITLTLPGLPDLCAGTAWYPSP